MNKEIEKKLEERRKAIAALDFSKMEIVRDKKESEGLGDTIAKITTKIGIKPCGACKKRQKKLNEIFPYKK